MRVKPYMKTFESPRAAQMRVNSTESAQETHRSANARQCSASPGLFTQSPLWLIAPRRRRIFRKLGELRAMTTKEIKSEIQKTLDNIHENAQQVILGYLKELEGKQADQILDRRRQAY